MERIDSPLISVQATPAPSASSPLKLSEIIKQVEAGTFKGHIITPKKLRWPIIS